MRLLPLLAVALVLTLFSSSCATITRGSTDAVIIRTQPQGASVMLSNGMSGTTPVEFALPRKESVVVQIELDGYKPVEVTLNPVMSSEGQTGMVGNLFVGGILGAAVDAGSGAMYDLTPNPLEVTLIALDSPQSYGGERGEGFNDLAEEDRGDREPEGSAAYNSNQQTTNGFGVEESFDEEPMDEPWVEIALNEATAYDDATAEAEEDSDPGQESVEAPTNQGEQNEGTPAPPAGGGPASVLSRMRSQSPQH